MRDRLVHRWLATQRTYVERDVKRVYYLSSEFLTGRSLGLCLMNLGLYEAAESWRRSYGFDLGAILEREGDPGLGNGGLGRLAACFMDSLATLRAARGRLRHPLRLRHLRAAHRRTGARSSSTTTGCSCGNPWELPRHEDAQTVRFGGRVEIQPRPRRPAARRLDRRRAT